MDKQSKDIIKNVLTVLLAVAVGEGVFGLGLYWPFLLMLLEWHGVYWFSLIIGILISAIYSLPIGLPSLFLVTVISGISLLFASRKETGLVILVISFIANFTFDKVFGMTWNLWDPVFIVLCWIFAQRMFERTESIRVSY